MGVGTIRDQKVLLIFVNNRKRGSEREYIYAFFTINTLFIIKSKFLFIMNQQIDIREVPGFVVYGFIIRVKREHFSSGSSS